MQRCHSRLLVQRRLPLSFAPCSPSAHPPAVRTLQIDYHPLPQLRTRTKLPVSYPSPLTQVSNVRKKAPAVGHRVVRGSCESRRYQSSAVAADVPSFAFAFEYNPSSFLPFFPSSVKLHSLTSPDFKYRRRSPQILSPHSRCRPSSESSPQQQYTLHSVDQWRWKARERTRRGAERETRRPSLRRQFCPVTYTVQAACRRFRDYRELEGQNNSGNRWRWRQMSKGR